MDDGYEKAHSDLYEALRAAGHTPQVAARKISAHYRASVQRAAQRVWQTAAEDSQYSDLEREHLRFAARWLGFEPPDAVVTINGCEMRLHGWRLSPLADWGGSTDRWGFFGWIRDGFDRDADIYNNPQLEAVFPGYEVPDSPLQYVEVKGYGDDRGLGLKLHWGRRV
jgi:hypothetical protein